MVRFCHFWRVTPEEYRRLRWDEFKAMVDYMNEVNDG